MRSALGQQTFLSAGRLKPADHRSEWEFRQVKQRRVSRWWWASAPVLVILLLALFWQWDWLIPLVEAQASSAAGRKITITHLHVGLRRITQLEADGITVASPAGFDQPLARIGALKIAVDVMAYIHTRSIALPLITLDQPVITALAHPDGKNNYTITPSKPASSTNKPASPMPKIGDLVINDGNITVLDPKLRADITLKIHTQAASGAVAREGQPSEVVMQGGGTYHGQKIRIDFTGGALLDLQKTGPYPLALDIRNGATSVSLHGTIEDPTAFKGVNLTLRLTGASMADLFPLTGIPIPATPAYKITGRLDYRDKRFRFENFEGTVGHSDLEGTITENPGKDRPDVTMDLASRAVDMADLGGFIGANPGDKAPPTQADKAAARKGKGTLLPNQPFNLPKIKAADIHLSYHADHIEGRSMPFDRLSTKLSVVDGDIRVHPIILGVGTGRILGNIDLLPLPNNQIHAKLEVDFQRVDLSRMMQSTHAFKGDGHIGGLARIDATGNSVASWMANGDGGLALYMAGGSLSALLVDLSGLQFGNALLSLLGIPSQTEVQCFIGDFGLRNGIVRTNALQLDTKEGLLNGTGSVNLQDQTIDYHLRTYPKHFSIGSLPTPIYITGKLNSPSIGLNIAPLAARGGAAVALGFLAGPLALLPTIQLGVGDEDRCSALLSKVRGQVHANMPGGVTGHH